MNNEPKPSLSEKYEYREIELTQGQVAKVSIEDFDELSKFKWQARWDRVLKNFYAIRGVRINGKMFNISMHRSIMGNPVGFEVDHIHGDTLDNRRSELRLATTSQNQMNSKIREDNSSGYKGVGWNARMCKWRSRINVDGKRKYLGSFSDPKMAYAAYCEAAAEHYGEFRRLS